MTGLRSTSAWSATKATLVCVLMALLNAAVWQWANPPLPAAQAALPLQGLAYNAFQRWQSPLEGQRPSDADVAADLELLRGITGRLRTYSASELSTLPALARARERAEGKTERCVAEHSVAMRNTALRGEAA